MSGKILGTARFRVPEGNVARALDAIAGFVDHVRREPGTERYVSLRGRDDPASFTHRMVFRDQAAEEAHSTSAAVERFTNVPYPLRDGPERFERFERFEPVVGRDDRSGG